MSREDIPLDRIRGPAIAGKVDQQARPTFTGLLHGDVDAKAVVLLCLWVCMWVCATCVGTLQAQPPKEAKGAEAAEATRHSEGLHPFLLGGIQTHELDHQRWMAALHRTGMNAVQVTVYAHQGPWNTSKLWYSEEEPAVLAEIRAARRNGLQVVLILRVALEHNEPDNRHLWHGLVYPETERATQDWFRTYTDFVVKWGRIAAREGVEVLGIASEMNALAATLPVEQLPHLAEYYLDDASQERLRNLVQRSKHLFTEDVRVSMGAGDFESLDDFLVQRNQAERVWAEAYTFAGAEDPISSINRRRRLLDAQWRQLVKEVRKVYPGRLTLAANFDNYHEVSFWDALDFIGINAYFPLRQTLETPLSEEGLADAWEKIFDDVKAFKKTHDLSQGVVLTELGYTRWQGVTVAPWSSQGFIPLWDPDGELANDRAFFWAAQPIEPIERAMALRALHRVWSRDRDVLSGVLYWKLSSVLDLQRFEPFMVYLGERAGEQADDPSLEALTRFADGIRPLSPYRIGDGTYLRAVDAVVRDDLQALTDFGPGILTVPRSGQTPLLHLAVRLGRKAMVLHLLSLGADPNGRDAGGFFALHGSCYQEDPNLVRLLLPSDDESWLDSTNETPLMKCARLDNETVARQLLQHRAGQSFDVVNHLGQSPLHLAADQASVPMVELLIAAGYDVNQHDHAGMTPLHMGARRGDLEIVKVLAADSKGVPNLDGNLPVHDAAIYGRDQVFHLLFEPEQAKAVNAFGQSILHLAAHGGDLNIVKTLLDFFPDVDPQDADGWTPLAFATRNGRLEVVELLLNRGASIEDRNIDGTPVLHLAASSYQPRLMQQFVGRDIDLNLADAKGNTALHISAGWGYLENIRFLLEAGADISTRNLEGDTALELAERFEKKRAAQLLRRATIRSTVPSPMR